MSAAGATTVIAAVITTRSHSSDDHGGGPAGESPPAAPTPTDAGTSSGHAAGRSAVRWHGELLISNNLADLDAKPPNNDAMGFDEGGDVYDDGHSLNVWAGRSFTVWEAAG